MFLRRVLKRGFAGWRALVAVALLAGCSRTGDAPGEPLPAPVAVGSHELLPPLFRQAERDPECRAPFPRFYAYRPAREGDARALVAIVWLDGTVRPEEPVHTSDDPRSVRARCIAPATNGGPNAGEWCCR